MLQLGRVVMSKISKKAIFISAILGSVALLPLTTKDANALTLRQAISKAMQTNPEILKSIENREATEFELMQARSAFLPSVDLEASKGKRRLNSPSRRSLGVQDDTLRSRDASVVLSWDLFDGGAKRAEVDKQASRVDGASFRVLERTEAIALAISQEYLEILLQNEVVGITKENHRVLGQIVDDISENVRAGILTSADTVQGQERLQASRVQLIQAQQDLVDAKIRFKRLVGVSLSNPKYPSSIRRYVPKSVNAALSQAVQLNPRLASTTADIDSANADVKAARSAFLPRVTFEARARHGIDVDGSQGETNDVEGKLVARWNLFRGGRDVAAVQEGIRRVGESQADRDIALREVKEAIEAAWNSRSKRAEAARELARQAKLNGELVSSYRSQFRVGSRSLLDVLSAQATRFDSEIEARTARYASIFAEYQILASVGGLTYALQTEVPEQTDAYARIEFGVQSVGDVLPPNFKRLPSRQVAGDPFDLLSGIDLD